MGFGNFLESSSSATDQTQTASGSAVVTRGGTHNQIIQPGGSGVGQDLIQGNGQKAGKNALGAGSALITLGNKGTYATTTNNVTNATTNVTGLTDPAILDHLAALQDSIGGIVTATNNAPTSAGQSNPNVAIDSQALGQSIGQSLSQTLGASNPNTSRNWFLIGGGALALIAIVWLVMRKKKP